MRVAFLPSDGATSLILARGCLALPLSGREARWWAGACVRSKTCAAASDAGDTLSARTCTGHPRSRHKQRALQRPIKPLRVPSEVRETEAKVSSKDRRRSRLG